jgi:hypothetical protein
MDLFRAAATGPEKEHRMPYYSVIAEVTVTRAYSVRATSLAEAEALVKEDYTLMEYDVLEETIDTIDAQEQD